VEPCPGLELGSMLQRPEPVLRCRACSIFLTDQGSDSEVSIPQRALLASAHGGLAKLLDVLLVRLERRGTFKPSATLELSQITKGPKDPS